MRSRDDVRSAVAIMQSVVLSPASPVPSKPANGSPEVHVVEVSPPQFFFDGEHDYLDKESISPREASAVCFPLEDNRYFSLPLSPLQPATRKTVVRHIDASEFVLPVSPLCGKNPIQNERGISQLAVEDVEMNPFKEVASWHPAETSDVEEYVKVPTALMPTRSSFSRLPRAQVEIERQSSLTNLASVPKYSPERDLLTQVRAVVGDIPSNIRSSSAATSRSTIPSDQDSQNGAAQRASPGMMPNGFHKGVSPGMASNLSSVSHTLTSSRFQVLQRDSTNFQTPQDSDLSPEPVRGKQKLMSFWCMKHHSSRNGTARRMLIFQVDVESVTISMKHPDGSHWKGVADTPLQTKGKDPQSVQVRRSDQIEVVSGVAAYCHPAIHRTKVNCPAHCLVISRQGHTLASVELSSLAELEACIKVLKSVSI
jgi:hypothetical protein